VKTKKITKKEWEAFIRIAKAEQKRASHKTYDFLEITWRYLPVPILIGLLAAFLMVHFYGWRALWENLLAWAIGLTVITTFIASVQRPRKG
jgi:hypothetical protein